MNDERAREAIDHLQTAALEFIAAVRAVLDVAEGFVRDASSRPASHDGDDITHIDVES